MVEAILDRAEDVGALVSVFAEKLGRDPRGAQLFAAGEGGVGAFDQTADDGAGTLDHRPGILDRPTVPGQAEVEVEELGEVEGDGEFCHRIGAVAVLEERGGVFDQQVAADQQAVIGLKEDDVGRVVAESGMDLQGPRSDSKVTSCPSSTSDSAMPSTTFQPAVVVRKSSIAAVAGP